MQLLLLLYMLVIFHHERKGRLRVNPHLYIGLRCWVIFSIKVSHPTINIGVICG